MADLSSILGSAGIGGAIGKAIVSLELDTKKYQAELQAANAQTTASANKMSTGLAAFGGLAKTAFLGAGAAAVAFGAFAVKSAIEANDAQLKLQNTFENNPKLADSSAEAFTRQADALRELTGVDDEAIIAGQALLGSFKLTGAQVQQLTPLVVDLASKYDIDLQAAFKAVGKATAGSSGILSRYGVVVNEANFQADAFGETLNALGVVEGFAADRADAEPWRVLGQEFEELSERLGQQLLPFLTSLAETGIKVVEALDPLFTLLGKMGPVVEALGTAFSFLVSPLGFVVSKFNELTGQSAAVDEALDKTVQKALENEVALRGLATASDKAAEAERRNKEAIDAVTESMREQLDAALSLADATFGLISATRENDDAEREYRQALERVNQLERRGKEDTKAYAEAKRDLRDKALAAAESELELANAARRLQQDIAEGKTSRKEAIQAIEDLGKEAGLTGNAIQRLKDDVRSGLNEASETAQRLAPGIGRNIVHGITIGIQDVAQGVADAAGQAVRDAIVAANRAAGAKSPSKEMAKLGRDLMLGLGEGLSKNQQKILDDVDRWIVNLIAVFRDVGRKVLESPEFKEAFGALQESLRETTKEVEENIRGIEKSVEKLGSTLDNVKSKASSFRGAISGAIGGFADIGGAFGREEFGGNLGAAISAQVGGAQQLAGILDALRRQGAGRALLAEVAETGAGFGQALLAGGPAQIAEANDALRTIAELSRETGKALSERFFGERVERLENRLGQLHEDLREQNQLLRRLEHGHDILMDGEKVAAVIRRELIHTGNRNGTTGIS